MPNEIQIVDDRFRDDRIKSASVLMTQSIDGDELQYDTLNAVIDFDKGSYLIDPGEYAYGSPVYVRNVSGLIGKFYTDKITRVGKTMYEIRCVSGVGILSNSQHYGGLYNGTPLSEMIASVLDGSVDCSSGECKITGGIIPCSISDELKDIPMFGWLPVDTRRQNLHQILFAVGAYAMKDKNGDMLISTLSTQAYQKIRSDKMYIGGAVRYPEKIKSVSVSEHFWIKTNLDKELVLFNGEISDSDVISPATGQVKRGSIVLFKNPTYDLKVENSSIQEKGVNYAILSPSADCTLKGKEYTHGVRQVSSDLSKKRMIEEKDNKIVVSDAWMVSALNSENVLKRVESYYSSAKIVTSNIVVGTERPGLAVEFVDPFGDPIRGIIKQMSMNLSNTIKSSTEVVSDFTPTKPGNFYNKSLLIVRSQTFIVPKDTSKIRVVLIGGGHGGAPGLNGDKGSGGITTGSGKGGDGGDGGIGGRIFIATIDVTPGQSLSFVIGSGGDSNAEGGATTLMSYSSADGNPSEIGYTDIFSGKTYALPGKRGIRGGAGVNTENPDGEKIIYNGVTYVPGSSGLGASTGSLGRVEGGYGGGPAAGANGGNGRDAKYARDPQNHVVQIISGNGGSGANAVTPPDSTDYGGGGNGGNGGGGGGRSGYVIESLDQSTTEGRGGSGGRGSLGSKGGPGLAIMYY